MAESSKDLDRPSSSTQKKVPIESLSHEELVKKCKTLLVISQKAKQAKDDVTEELKELKHDRNVHLAEIEKHKVCSEKLANQLRKVAEEKENVLVAIESVKLNNGELQNIVRKISTERDALFEEVNQLNTEKQKLVKVLAATGEQNDSIIDENRLLKAEKRKLNDELFANISLQDACSAKIKGLEVELNKLLEESGSVAHLLQIEDNPEQNTETLEGLLSVVSQRFYSITSNIKSGKLSENNAALTDKSPNSSDITSKEGTGSAGSHEDVLGKLREEVARLSKLVEDYKTESITLSNDNTFLKGEVDRLQLEYSGFELSLKEGENVNTELRTELESVRQASAQKTTEIALLKDETSLLMERNKEQVVNLMEMKGLRNEIEKLKNLLTEKEDELKAHKESQNDAIKLQLLSQRESYDSQIKNMEDQVANKDLEIGRLRQEIENAILAHEKCDSNVEALRKELFDLQRVVEVNQGDKKNMEEAISCYSNEIQSFKKEIPVYQQELEEKKKEIETVRDEMLKMEEVNSKHVIAVDLLHKERDELQIAFDVQHKELEKIKNENVLMEKSNASFRSKVEALESDLLEFRQINEANECKEDSIKETISKYVIEIETLRNELKNLQENVSEKDKKICFVSQERENIEQENMKNCLAVKNLEKTVTNLKQQLSDKDQQIMRLEQELRNIELNDERHAEEVVKLKNEIVALQKVVEEEDAQLTILKKEKSDIETIKEQAHSEHDVLKNQVVALQSELKERERNYGIAEENMSQYILEIESLKNEVTNLHKHLEESKHKIAMITQEREEIIENNILTHSTGIEALQKEILNLQASLVQKEAEISDMQTVLAERELLVSNMQARMTDKEQEIVNAHGSLAKKKAKISSLQTNFAEKQQEIVRLQENLRDKEQQIENIKTNLTGNELEISNLQKSVAEKEQKILQFLNDKENIEQSNAKCSVDIEALKEELSTLQHRIESNNVQYEQTLTETESKYSSEISILKEKILELSDVVQVKDEELEKFRRLEQTLTESSESLLREQQVNKDRATEIEFLQAECKQYVISLNKMQKDFTEQLKVADERYNAKQESLVDELVNIQNSSAETEATLSKVLSELAAMKAVEGEVAVLKRENSELLGEMNEMNQVLKKRGESVSKLEKVNDELQKELKETSASLEKATQDLKLKTSELESRDTEVSRLCAEVKELSEQLSAKDSSHKELFEEVGKLRSRLQQLEREVKESVSGDATSEVMSCSTLGRAEESSRLKDLEDTFEERYTKLRTIAVKLKKRVAELTAQVSALESDKVKLSTELQAKVVQLSASAKNLQTIQQECDRQQDALEVQKRELKETTRLLEETVTDATAVKQRLQELGEERDRLTTDLDFCTLAKLSVETQVKELTTEVQNLKKEKGEHDAEIKKLKEEVKKCEQLLKEEERKHKATRNELDVKEQKIKKNSVLCLEMDDYEKSVADLSQQLSAERVKVAELTSHLENQREIADGLKEQIRLLEDGLAAEEARSSEVIGQLAVLRTRLSEAATVSSEREADINKLKTEVETHRVEAEKAALLLSQVAAEKQKAEDNGRLRADALTSQLRHAEDELKACRSQLSSLSADFEGYKVRAQSVLRQKARPDDAGREDCVEEIAQLRHAAEVTRSKLEETASRLLAANGEITTLQQDRDRILDRCRQLSESVASLSAENQQLVERAKELMAEHREATSKQKIHHETLVQCYKTQLEELEERLSTENAVLRDQLDRLEAGTRHESKAAFLPVQLPVNEIVMLEREEGEGSESIHSSSPQNSSQGRHELMPLDKLLALQPEDEAVQVTSISPASELSKTRDQLGMSERQIRHLAGLLAEAEQDLARLTQLNDVLKEEIRRNQRSEEREKHAHNQEYLKNVIFKFVTLQGGDERSRLVPVLNTLLKLSPEETKQLSSVAKAGAERHVAGGWGNYLHLWPSTQ